MQANPAQFVNLPANPENRDAWVIERFIADRPSIKTREAYARQIRRFRMFCPRPLRTVTLRDLEEYKQALQEGEFTGGSVRAMLVPIRGLFAYLHQLGLAPVNVAAALKLPPENNATPIEQRIVPAEVIQAIVDAAPNDSVRTMLMFMRDTGFRASEVVSVTWADIAPLGEYYGVTVCGKGRKYRTVTILPELYARLKLLRRENIWHENERVFPISRQSVFNRVKAAVRKARENPAVSPHWFRHAFVSHLLDAGVKVHEVRELAGHEKLETTSRYAHARSLPCPGAVLGTVRRTAREMAALQDNKVRTTSIG